MNKSELIKVVAAATCTKKEGEIASDSSPIRFRLGGVILMLAIGAFFLSGCAIGVTRVQLSHNPLERIENKKQENILIEPFVDARKDREHIGNKRNAFGMVLGHIGTEEGVNLDTVLTGYFADALRAAGYNAILKGEAKSAEQVYNAVLTGKISEFWMDLYMAVWHYMRVNLEIIDPAARHVLWSKEVKGEQKRVLWVGATGEYERIIGEATTNALNEAVKAFSSDEFAEAIRQGSSRH